MSIKEFLFNYCKCLNFDECINVLKFKLKRQFQIDEYDLIYGFQKWSSKNC